MGKGDGGREREREEGGTATEATGEMMGDGLEAELWMHRRAPRWTFE